MVAHMPPSDVGHEIEHGGLLARAPGTKGFAEVGVEIEDPHVFGSAGVARVNRTTPVSFCVS
jgi:hypothetical protein